MKVTVRRQHSKEETAYPGIAGPIAIERKKAIADVAKKAKIRASAPAKRRRTWWNVTTQWRSTPSDEPGHFRFLPPGAQGERSEPRGHANITNISSLEADAPLNFTAVVEVRPKFDLGNTEASR